MNKTSIEWVRNPDGSQGYTWNPITGCLNNDNGLCKGGDFPCYAYKLANGRLKPLYLANDNIAPLSEGREWIPMRDILDPFYPRFWEERLDELKPRKGMRFFPMRSPKGIFVCDMGDLFGIGVPEKWTRKVLDVIGRDFLSADRFYLLTKQPQNLIKFSPFPENCWVGVTATGYKAFNNALDKLKCVEAKVKYISIEPLLEAIPFNMERLAYCGINWLIIGACTGTRKEMLALADRYHQATFARGMPLSNGRYTLQPKIEWVQEIVEAADKAGIKVFLKDNLSPLLGQLTINDKWAWAKDIGYGGLYRQEMPSIVRIPQFSHSAA